MKKSRRTIQLMSTQPFLKNILESWSTAYIPEEYFTGNKTMISVKTELEKFTALKAKGETICALTGYVLNRIIFTGKKSSGVLKDGIMVLKC